jgi:SEC-C motif-containing protein
MATAESPSRNDPCPCGSGRKYKKCCGAPAAAPVSPAQPWHDLDDRLTKELSDYGRRRFGDDWAHILADYPVDEEEMERVPAHMNLFIQWLCHENKFEG